ncbi:Coiled-coil domain-containing protein 40 [Coelomomyces lativittatus]|nr:Coiled-coil domain-containing protein 40 [Coelomomyces lativittatus]
MSDPNFTEETQINSNEQSSISPVQNEDPPHNISETSVVTSDTQPISPHEVDLWHEKNTSDISTEPHSSLSKLKSVDAFASEKNEIISSSPIHSSSKELESIQGRGTLSADASSMNTLDQFITPTSPFSSSENQSNSSMNPSTTISLLNNSISNPPSSGASLNATSSIDTSSNTMLASSLHFSQQGPISPSKSPNEVKDDGALSSPIDVVSSDPTTFLSTYTSLNDGSTGLHPPDTLIESQSTNPELEENLALLDPDNPLLKRVQDALKQQLTHLNKSLRKAGSHRESLGVELYSIHEHLRQFQTQLNELDKQVEHVQKVRVSSETQLQKFRNDHVDESSTVTQHQRAWQDRQRELETLMRTYRHLEMYSEELKSSLMTTRRVTLKSEQALIQQEEEKRKQDEQIQQLSDRLDALEKQKYILDQQTEVQKKEIQASKNILQEANLEMEAIMFEKRQLFHQWKSGILGLERRQEVLSELDQSIRKEKETLLSMDHELEGFKKTIESMQQENETLDHWHTQLHQETHRLESQIQQTHTQKELHLSQYHVMQMTLEKHEHALKQTQLSRQTCMNELNATKKQFLLAQQKCRKLESELHELSQWQQSMEKSMSGTQKDVQKLLLTIQDKENNVAMYENQVAEAHLEGTRIKQWNDQLKLQLSELDGLIKEKNSIIEKYEVELRRGNDDMTKKQSEIDIMNKKLSYLLTHATEATLGPLEATIHNLTKLVNTKEKEGWELQQFWLKNQNELVQLAKKSSELSETLITMKMRLTILTRKKQMLNQEFDAQEREIKYHSRNIKALQNEMTKINGLLSKQMSVQTQLEENNLGLEQEFRYRLKEAELASLRLEQKVRDLKAEKEQAFLDLMDAERQIMLWEKKIQLAKETREALDPNIGAQEIKDMKMEIHRMELRLQNLQKVQEKLINEMEKGVIRRETIATRSKLRGKGYSQATLTKQIEELTKKLKWTLADLRDLDQDGLTLHQAEQTLQQQINELQQNIQLLQNRHGYLLNEVQCKLDEKTLILNEMAILSKKSKRYQLLKNGKYPTLKGTVDTIRVELQKVQENLSKFEKSVEMLMAEQSSQLSSAVDILQSHFTSARQYVIGTVNS